MSNLNINNNIIKKTFQLIFFSFIAKGSGFVREMILAYYYGATSISDIYIAVQNIPSIIFSIFGTAITTGFIPLYSELNVMQGKKVADKFTNNVFNIFLVLSFFLTVLGIIFSNELVYIFAGGFSGETFILCNNFAKIIMPTSMAIILVYVYNAYLQIEGRFNQSSLMNLPYNILQILFIVLSFYTNNIYLLAIGILLSSFSQLMYLRILMKKNTNFIHDRHLSFKDPHIIKMLILVGPVFISTGVNQINSMVDRSLASGLVEGSVSALNYSSEISNIVVHVIILSLTTILYPKMTQLFLKNDEIQKNQFTERYLNIVTILIFPLSALLFVFSKEIIQILFGRGAFTEETVVFVSKALKIYILGIAGTSFRDVLNRIFYSMKDTITPLINGIITVLCNIGLNFLLVRKYEYLGLAFGTTIAAKLCTLLMFLQLTKRMKGLNSKFIIKELVIALFSTGIMVLVISILKYSLIIRIDFWRCIIFSIIGSIIYLLVLFVLKESLVIEMLGKIKLIKKKDLIGNEK